MLWTLLPHYCHPEKITRDCANERFEETTEQKGVSYLQVNKPHT